MSSERCIALARWVLRIIIAVQCYGLAVQLLFSEFETETNVYGLLFHDLKFSEDLALLVEDAGTWIYFLGSLFVLIIPAIIRIVGGSAAENNKHLRRTQIVLLTWIAFWQILLAVLIVVRKGQFMSEWMIAAHATRFMVPLALIQLLRDPDQSNYRITTVGWLLRCGISATFMTHGLEAIYENPGFEL